MVRDLTAKAEKAILGILCREAAAGAHGYAAVSIGTNGKVYCHQSPSRELGADEFFGWTPRSLRVWERTRPHNSFPRDVFAWTECADGEYIGNPATRENFSARARSASWVADRLSAGWVRFDCDEAHFADPGDHLNRDEIRQKIDAWVDVHYTGDGS